MYGIDKYKADAQRAELAQAAAKVAAIRVAYHTRDRAQELANIMANEDGQGANTRIGPAKAVHRAACDNLERALFDAFGPTPKLWGEPVPLPIEEDL